MEEGGDRMMVRILKFQLSNYEEYPPPSNWVPFSKSVAYTLFMSLFIIFYFEKVISNKKDRELEKTNSFLSYICSNFQKIVHEETIRLINIIFKIK